MNTNFPPISVVRTELEGLSHSEVQELSRQSTVPFTTLWKIRDGTTKNPGIETVRSFYPLIKKCVKPVQPSAAEQPAKGKGNHAVPAPIAALVLKAAPDHDESSTERVGGL